MHRNLQALHTPLRGGGSANVCAAAFGASCPPGDVFDRDASCTRGDRLNLRLDVTG